MVIRLIVQEMAKAKGWTIEPINKPGAVGGIATNYVLQQPADGYTLLGAANFNKFVRVMGHAKSKTWEDWTVMQAAASLASWSVRAESEFKSVDDMVKFAKNGSDITTAAVKLARAYTGRQGVVVFDADLGMHSGRCRNHNRIKRFFVEQLFMVGVIPFCAESISRRRSSRFA